MVQKNDLPLSALETKIAEFANGIDLIEAAHRPNVVYTSINIRKKVQCLYLHSY